MTGNTATIAFGSSGFTAKYHEIDTGPRKRKAIPTSHLGTTGGETFDPGDLVDPGQAKCEIEYNPDSPPPITAAAESITITFPVPSGKTHGATKAGTGFLVEDNGAKLKNNELIMGGFTLQWSGLPVYTAAS